MGPAPVVPPAPPVGGAVPVLFGGGGSQLPDGSQQVPPVQARPDPQRLSSHGQPSEPTTQKLVPLPVASPAPFTVPAEPKLAPAPFAPPLPRVPDAPVELFPEQAATKIANAAQNFEACRMGKPFLSRCGETRTSSSKLRQRGPRLKKSTAHPKRRLIHPAHREPESNQRRCERVGCPVSPRHICSLGEQAVVRGLAGVRTDARGFLRARCRSSGNGWLVARSCKRRGVCPPSIAPAFSVMHSTVTQSSGGGRRRPRRDGIVLYLVAIR